MRLWKAASKPGDAGQMHTSSGAAKDCAAVLQAGGEVLDVGFQARQIRGPNLRTAPARRYAVAVGRQRAGRVQQELEHLVVGRDLDAVVEAQLAHPEGERRFDSIRREGGADDDGRAGHRIHHHYRGRRVARKAVNGLCIDSTPSGMSSRSRCGWAYRHARITAYAQGAAGRGGDDGSAFGLPPAQGRAEAAASTSGARPRLGAVAVANAGIRRNGPGKLVWPPLSRARIGQR
jgi:hypothetical protein